MHFTTIDLKSTVLKIYQNRIISLLRLWKSGNRQKLLQQLSAKSIKPGIEFIDTHFLGSFTKEYLEILRLHTTPILTIIQVNEIMIPTNSPVILIGRFKNFLNTRNKEMLLQ